MNEGQRAIENCVKCERYEMTVEWIEVWTLFAVCYTCLILMYFIAFDLSFSNITSSVRDYTRTVYSVAHSRERQRLMHYLYEDSILR